MAVLKVMWGLTFIVLPLHIKVFQAVQQNIKVAHLRRPHTYLNK